MLLDAENIKKALSQTLPGSTSHRRMLPVNRELVAEQRRTNPPETQQRFAFALSRKQ